MGYKENTVSDRLKNSADAKKALLEKFRAQPGADDPIVLARTAERRAIADAREKRIAEREAAREAEARRLAAEQAAREAEARRLAEEQAKLDEERKAVEAAAKVELEAQQKAARDARYAARKARKKK
jgi:Family of unknown function (DUF6481)